WFAGSCSGLPMLISKLHLAKHIGSGRDVKVCYAPVKICKPAGNLPDLAASGTAASPVMRRPAVVAKGQRHSCSCVPPNEPQSGQTQPIVCFPPLSPHMGHWQ